MSSPLTWSSLVGDQGCFGPNGKLSCLCETPKIYAAHAWHHSFSPLRFKYLLYFTQVCTYLEGQ